MELASGKFFDDLFDTVLGADEACDLGYNIGDPIIVAHGAGRIGIQKHDDKPYRVVDVRKKTGTPVDRTIHVSLEAIEAIHFDWKNGARTMGQRISAGAERAMDLEPTAITSALIGVSSKIKIFGLQRFINQYRS